MADNPKEIQLSDLAKREIAWMHRYATAVAEQGRHSMTAEERERFVALARVHGSTLINFTPTAIQQIIDEGRKLACPHPTRPPLATPAPTA